MMSVKIQQMPLDPGALCMLMQYILKIILIFLHLQKFEAIHNKDYSVVKTFKAGLSGLAFFFLGGLLRADLGLFL